MVCLETCDVCGFTWDTNTADIRDCVQCEFRELPLSGNLWQKDNEEAMAEIRKFFGGHRELPMALKHAVQMLIYHCEGVERRLLEGDVQE